jgi:hypothetical protein
VVWEREPTEPGVYWVRNDWLSERRGRQFVLRDRMPVLVTSEPDGLRVYVPGSEGSRGVNELPALWFGPIDPPEFARETELRLVVEAVQC